MLTFLLLNSLVWERPNYHSSPSIERSIDSALRVSDLTKEDIDLYDFYSYVAPPPAAIHVQLVPKISLGTGQSAGVLNLTRFHLDVSPLSPRLQHHT